MLTLSDIKTISSSNVLDVAPDELLLNFKEKWSQASSNLMDPISTLRCADDLTLANVGGADFSSDLFSEMSDLWEDYKDVVIEEGENEIDEVNERNQLVYDRLETILKRLNLLKDNVTDQIESSPFLFVDTLWKYITDEHQNNVPLIAYQGEPVADQLGYGLMTYQGNPVYLRAYTNTTELLDELKINWLDLCIDIPTGTRLVEDRVITIQKTYSLFRISYYANPNLADRSMSYVVAHSISCNTTNTFVYWPDPELSYHVGLVDLANKSVESLVNNSCLADVIESVKFSGSMSLNSLQSIISKYAGSDCAAYFQEIIDSGQNLNLNTMTCLIGKYIQRNQGEEYVDEEGHVIGFSPINFVYYETNLFGLILTAVGIIGTVVLSLLSSTVTTIIAAVLSIISTVMGTISPYLDATQSNVVLGRENECYVYLNQPLSLSFTLPIGDTEDDKINFERAYAEFSQDWTCFDILETVFTHGIWKDPATGTVIPQDFIRAREPLSLNNAGSIELEHNDDNGNIDYSYFNIRPLEGLGRGRLSNSGFYQLPRITYNDAIPNGDLSDAAIRSGILLSMHQLAVHACNMLLGSWCRRNGSSDLSALKIQIVRHEVVGGLQANISKYDYSTWMNHFLIDDYDSYGDIKTAFTAGVLSFFISSGLLPGFIANDSTKQFTYNGGWLQGVNDDGSVASLISDADSYHAMNWDSLTALINNDLFSRFLFAAYSSLLYPDSGVPFRILRMYYIDGDALQPDTLQCLYEDLILGGWSFIPDTSILENHSRMFNNVGRKWPSVSKSALITASIIAGLVSVAAVTTTLVVRNKSKNKALARVAQSEQDYNKAKDELLANPSDPTAIKAFAKSNRKYSRAKTLASKLGVTAYNGMNLNTSIPTPSDSNGPNNGDVNNISIEDQMQNLEIRFQQLYTLVTGSLYGQE